MPHAFRYGIAAIIAMLHDVLVVLGIAAILGHFLRWEVDALFLTALLTVIGFSVHDTIVVFDRIRENATILPPPAVRDHRQPLDRADPGPLDQYPADRDVHPAGAGIVRRRDHRTPSCITLLIGVFSGTYSSIFNAAPILVVWENREWRTWFHKKPVAASNGRGMEKV